MTMVCPCCRRPMLARPGEAINPREIVRALPLGPLTRDVAFLLVEKFGAFVRRRELIDAAYADDPDGGPLTAEIGVTRMIRHLRRELEGTALEVESRRRCGYRLVLRAGVWGTGRAPGQAATAQVARSAA